MRLRTGLYVYVQYLPQTTDGVLLWSWVLQSAKQLKAVLARQYFAAHGVECRILPLPTNEANKNFDLVFEIARQLEEFKLNRFVFAHYRAPWPMFKLACLSCCFGFVGSEGSMRCLQMLLSEALHTFTARVTCG